MKTSEYIILLHKKLRGEIEPNEQQALDNWLATQPDEQLADEIEQTWEWSGRYGSSYEPDTAKGLADFQAKLQAAKSTPQPKVVRLRPRFSWWAAAASLLLLLGLWWWSSTGQGAGDTLMFATTTGEVREINLPDGTVVTMNESSNLTFSASESQREATFSGEAFFAVAKDKKRPFSIAAHGTRTRVLGTAFNLRAYPGESTVEVEVKEGLVSLKGTSNQEAIELRPQERGVCEPEVGKLYKLPAKDLNAQAWHTHELQFTAVPFKDAMVELERYFRIDLELENKAMADCRFNAAYQNSSKGELLENLRLVFGFKVDEIGEGQYRLEGGRCR
jgi:ferric-dicitrate binding protein FerR (iron transport regulator)